MTEQSYIAQMYARSEAAAAELAAHFPKDTVLQTDPQDQQVIVTLEQNALKTVLVWLRDHPRMRFRQLVDLFAVDYPDRAERFEVVYLLLSYEFNTRIALRLMVAEEEEVSSVSSVYSAATWYEREAWDLYGVRFSDMKDQRRLLTDYDFQGHPFRKDFPLSGYVEPRYDEDEKRVVYESVQLPQEYREFDMLSPWEGLTPEPPPEAGQAAASLPGDEKATKGQ